ncbi:MAG: hypothetical protein ABSD72_06725 [Terracidiphilus sp.]|jgi:hypothetical protein
MSDHFLSVITAWATSIAALAAATAVWVSWRGIIKQNEQAKVSREDFKLSLAADLSMKLDDRFNPEDFSQARSDAARALLSNQNLVDAENVFDFFETVGLLVRTGALTNELAYNFFFHWINLYWVAGQSHIEEKRKVSRTLWQDFEYVYKEVREIETKKDPNSEDLRLAEQPERLEVLLREETAEKENSPHPLQ